MVTKCFPSLCVGVKSCWSQTAQRLFWRAQPPETWTTTKQTPQESKDKPMDAEHPKSFYTNNKDFLPLNTSFVLKQKKSEKRSDTRKKSLSLFLNICPSFLHLHICIYTPDSPLLLVSLGLSVSRSSWPTPCRRIAVSGPSDVQSATPSVSKSPAGPVDSCTILITEGDREDQKGG